MPFASRFLWLAALPLLTGCGMKLLSQPAVHPGDASPQGAYYVVPDSLPRLAREKDCKALRRDGDAKLSSSISPAFSLAICDVNQGRLEEARDHASGIADSCVRALFDYDLRMKEGLSKRRRFEALDNLLTCSPDPDFRRMVRVRGKVAPYEAD